MRRHLTLRYTLPVRLWTIGHSTRTLDELVGLLRTHDVDTLVDVRTLPRSRRHPHFTKDALAASLPQAAIAYVHMPGLGGLRKARPDSPNTGWRTGAFRGYADYMQTDDFERHLEALTARAMTSQLSVMCAEAEPWRCHRNLLADALVVRGAEVRHIVGEGAVALHVLTAGAQRDGVRLSYPPAQRELPF
jgi:uncharacterized protein (DUF488 family)